MLETDVIKIVAWKGSQSVLYNPTVVFLYELKGAPCTQNLYSQGVMQYRLNFYDSSQTR